MESEIHNKITNEFMTRAVRQILDHGGQLEDVMVLAESMIMGLMLVNKKYFNIPDSNNSIMFEIMLNEATKRFAQENRKDERT